MRGGVKGRLELFRKFIRFWRAIRPYAKGGLQKCAKFIHRKEWKWFCWCSSKGIPISRFGEDVKRKEKWSLKSVGRWLAVSVVARKILTCKSKMYKIENSLQLQNDILRRTLEGWAKEEPEVNKQINDKNFSVSLAKDFPFWLLMPSLYGADKKEANTRVEWKRCLWWAVTERSLPSTDLSSPSTPLCWLGLFEKNHQMPTTCPPHIKEHKETMFFRLMLGATSGNSTRLSVSVPTTKNALACLLKVLCYGEANTNGCSPEQVLPGDVCLFVCWLLLSPWMGCCYWRFHIIINININPRMLYIVIVSITIIFVGEGSCCSIGSGRSSPPSSSSPPSKSSPASSSSTPSQTSPPSKAEWVESTCCCNRQWQTWTNGGEEEDTK